MHSRVQDQKVRTVYRALIEILEKAEQDKEDFKNVYNNYFLQVQTLINQKTMKSLEQKSLSENSDNLLKLLNSSIKIIRNNIKREKTNRSIKAISALLY